MKTIRIATQGTPHDYQESLLPIVIKHLGYKINWVAPSKADLFILGPFIDHTQKKFSWWPKPLRPVATSISNSISKLTTSRQYQPLKLFHTQENVRHDFVDADYSVSFDLGVQSDNHFRLPYWMEMIDWSHEGIQGNINPRYGELLALKNLTSPLGDRYLKRGGSCALLSSHLREPRASLFRALEKVIPIEGFGAHFNKEIKNHHSSGFLKKNILDRFSFNLCPENGLYPGYYTEKIPEAFNSGCLPITWADENISADFNTKAFINMHPLASQGYESVSAVLSDQKILARYAHEPLIQKEISLGSLKNYLRSILHSIA